MKLSDRNWKLFYLSELFEITSTQSGIDKNKLNQKRGLIPYITRTDKNNGIECYIASQDIKYKIDNGKVITIGLDTQTVFYQPYHFYTGQNIQVLKNEYISKYAALFILPSLSLLLKNFNWGSTGATLGRLKNSQIFLPMNKKGNPDYEFMEAYMREKEEKLKKQYKNFISFRLSKKCKRPITPTEWKEFEIEQIFNSIQRGKRLIKNNHIKGKIPYVSSSGLNNGVDNYIHNTDNIRKFKNCLSIANSGSVGTCFYEPFEFIASDHITHLKGNFSSYTYLYLTRIIEQIKVKYNFNREINDNRIKKERILLPITSSGQPDYEYMENYMKYLEQQKLQEYIKYIEKKD